MSLVTRCPRCQTLFRVTPIHLQAASGQVRCGRCMHVFDGFGALTAEHDNVRTPVRFEPDPAPVTVKADAQAATPPAAPAAGNPFAKADAVPETRTGAQRLTPAVRWATAGALLVLVLALQMAYGLRKELAGRYPALRGALESVCDFAGCTVALPQRPDLVRIEASDVHMIDANRPSLIQLTATMRSYANYYLAYPALDLVLTNANEHALARRVFLPADYIGRGRHPKAGIPPNAEITVALDLDTGDLNAAGFRLDLLPAP